MHCWTLLNQHNSAAFCFLASDSKFRGIICNVNCYFDSRNRFGLTGFRCCCCIVLFCLIKFFAYFQNTFAGLQNTFAALVWAFSSPVKWTLIFLALKPENDCSVTTSQVSTSIKLIVSLKCQKVTFSSDSSKNGFLAVSGWDWLRSKTRAHNHNNCQQALWGRTALGPVSVHLYLCPV